MYELRSLYCTRVLFTFTVVIGVTIWATTTEIGVEGTGESSWISKLERKKELCNRKGYKSFYCHWTKRRLSGR